MEKLKTSISLSKDILEWVDGEIKKKRFASRSHAVEYCIHKVMERK